MSDRLSPLDEAAEDCDLELVKKLAPEADQQDIDQATDTAMRGVYLNVPGSDVVAYYLIKNHGGKFDHVAMREWKEACQSGRIACGH